jgi:hypothetical protein
MDKILTHPSFFLGASVIVVAWIMQIVTGSKSETFELRITWIMIGIGLMLIDIGLKFLFGV